MGSRDNSVLCMDFLIIMCTAFLVKYAESQAQGVDCTHEVALGMESGAILDQQIAASSMLAPQYAGTKARLNYVGAWYALKTDNQPWIQVDLRRRTAITKLAIQGYSAFVGEFYLSYTDDITNWSNYTEAGTTKIFQGNTDGRNTKNITISPPIVGQFFRFYATKWQQYCALRMELYGCNYTSVTLPPFYTTQAPASCRTLQTPQGGSMSCKNGFLINSICNFSCQASYTLGGNSLLICQSDGKWDESEPVCYRLPSKISSVNLTEALSNLISISWSKPSDGSSLITDYEVQWKTGEIVSQKLTSKTSASLEVRPHTSYEIRVRASNSYGRGLWSESLSVRSDEAAPSMTPPDFQVTSVRSLELTVSWQAIPPDGCNGVILGYYLDYYQSDRPEVVNRLTLDANTLSTKLIKLDYAPYYVSVAGYTRVGEGPFTSRVKKTPNEGAPTPPQNLRASVQGSTAVLLTWGPPAKANGIIQRYVVKFGMHQDQMTRSQYTSGQTNSTLVAALEEYSTYHFNVFAETSVTGQPSNIISVTTADDAPDAAPAITSIVPRDAYTIYVAWTRVPQKQCNGIILGYTVFYSILGQPTRNVTFHDETKLSTEITGLHPYAEYCIKMAAFTRVGLTKNWKSNGCSWIKTLQTGPSSPVNVKGQAESSIAIRIEWDKPLQPNGIITEYIIYYGPAEGNLQFRKNVTSNTLSAVITGLRKFTNYYFQVRGKTSKPGNASHTIMVQTKEDVPGPPVAFTGEPASPDSTLLIWNKPNNVNGILRSYVIRTYEKSTGKRVGTVMNRTAYPLDNPKTPITTLVIGLRPYRAYVHSLAAYTIGEGPAVNCTVTTKEGVPSAPQSVQANLVDLIITVEWKKPQEMNGVLNAYTVYCMGSRKYQPMFSDPKIASVTPDTFTYQLSRLEPGTSYTVYVTGSTVVGEGDKSEKIVIITASQPPPAPKQPEYNTRTVTSTTITIFLTAASSSNGEVIAHQIIVKKLTRLARRSRRRRSSTLPDFIGSYEDAKKSRSPFYVAAEFRQELPTEFVVGDDKFYTGYHNAPLEPETEYEVFIRGVTADKNGKWVYGEPSAVTLPATARAVKPSDTGSDKNVGLIAGVVGALILIAIIIIAVVLYRRAKRLHKPNLNQTKSKRRFRDLELMRLAGKKRPLSNPGELTNDPEHPPVPVDNFAKHVHKLHKSDDRGFMIEYNKLDAGREFPCDVAYNSDNKAKNRYGNIVAYDHSRVVLNEIENVRGSDYINASHIDGYNKPNAYIATQGPIPTTFDDFWRMVWEQQSASIVMLTNLQERHKLKCHKYWPDETEEYGDIGVQLLRSEHYADYSIRTFNVKRDAEKEEREVKQFHFTVWPDHGVPEYPTAILAFRRRVRAYNPPDAGPVIIHCSAGVGRSGTFIVIDAMLDRVNAESSLDIFNYVAYLRTRRTAMVQTEEQYTFCHDAVLEAIQCGNTQILAHDLRITLSRMEDVDKELKMTRFDSEFKTLNKVSPILPKACYIVASYPENKDKNRYSDILASDFSRVVLTAIDDNEITTYINAVHISGYKQQHAFIVTQYPLTATVSDFWRMLSEQDSACVVLFQPTEEGDFPQFWPEVGKETYDMISVECSDERSSSVDNLRASYDQSEIAQLRFNVKDLRTPENLHKIKMFVVSGWTSEDETPPTSSIITLIAKVERWQQQSGNGPITVVCSDGIGRSGTFSALYSVLERVKIEQVIDVLQAIKAMRIPRPGLVKTTAEYKFIHYAVQEYLAAFDDYANFK